MRRKTEASDGRHELAQAILRHGKPEMTGFARCGPDCRLHPRWQELKRQGLDVWPTVLTAPLRSFDINDERFDWYETEALPSVPCDVLVIVGPPPPLVRLLAILPDHDCSAGSGHERRSVSMTATGSRSKRSWPAGRRSIPTSAKKLVPARRAAPSCGTGRNRKAPFPARSSRNRSMHQFFLF